MTPELRIRVRQELKTGMRIRIGDMAATVEEVGPPENLRTWKYYTGQDNGELIETLRKSQVTCCAMLAFDEEIKRLFIIEWRNYWWSLVGKMRLDLHILKPPQ